MNLAPFTVRSTQIWGERDGRDTPALRGLCDHAYAFDSVVRVHSHHRIASGISRIDQVSNHADLIGGMKTMGEEKSVSWLGRTALGILVVALASIYAFNSSRNHGSVPFALTPIVLLVILFIAHRLQIMLLIVLLAITSAVMATAEHLGRVDRVYLAASEATSKVSISSTAFDPSTAIPTELAPFADRLVKRANWRLVAASFLSLHRDILRGNNLVIMQEYLYLEERDINASDTVLLNRAYISAINDSRWER